jgi:histidine ammonia-lyase
MTELPAIHIARLYSDLRARMAELRRAHPRVGESRRVVERALADGKAYYGINTGFGALASKRIDPNSLDQLQYNLLVSHAVGLGELVPREIARLMLELKVHSLSLGYSGISAPVFERLLTFAERGLVPAMPCKGSLGASGDLAPLAHMSLPLIGKGKFWNRAGTGTVDAETVLTEERLSPVTLGPKDGLALINGTQLMAAYGAFVLERALTLVKNADVLACLSLEALRGSIAPFDSRVHAVRPHPGQSTVAQNVRLLMTDSEILESHKECGRVQDPYCLRCVPQVHGASRDALDYARNVLEIELNSVTDNPLVFEDGSIVSGGNFHGQPLALALDFAAIALAELASISERRIYLLLTGHDGLPTLLMKDTGLNSGFMIPQYTAAALVSQNKVLCHPASVDSIPSCLGQEDHVSMGSIAALKLLEVLDNVEKVLAIEALTAAQALDYRKPLAPGKGVEAAHACLRDAVAHKEADAYFGDDIERAVSILRSGELAKHVERAVGALI